MSVNSREDGETWGTVKSDCKLLSDSRILFFQCESLMIQVGNHNIVQKKWSDYLGESVNWHNNNNVKPVGFCKTDKPIHFFFHIGFISKKLMELWAAKRLFLRWSFSDTLVFFCFINRSFRFISSNARLWNCSLPLHTHGLFLLCGCSTCFTRHKPLKCVAFVYRSR